MMTTPEGAADMTFPHAYECALIDDLPGHLLPHYFYPGGTQRGGRDGLVVRTRSASGREWLGTFAFGSIARDGISGISSLPDPTRICVVSRGQGYIVNAEMPESWETVDATPVMAVRPILSQGIAVFATYVDLVAYGVSGIKWRTRRLAWDSLRITEVTDLVIRGEFWDVRSGEIRTFAVDAVTGDHEGGLDLALS
jgi:hypothetical protein